MATTELGEFSSIVEMYDHYKDKTGCGDVAAAILALADVIGRTPAGLASSIENGLDAVSSFSVRVSGEGIGSEFETRRSVDSKSRDDANPSLIGRESANSGIASATVLHWMNRNGITQEHLDQVFHVEAGKVTVIADSVPGVTKKEQTVNCYILEGMRAFLETGAAKFTDADADALCERIGCRDKTNHATNRASAGNKMTGSRTVGFTIVAPGMFHAASLIKQIANLDVAASK